MESTGDANLVELGNCKKIYFSETQKKIINKK